VKNGDAAALAEVLARNFKGEATVSALPTGNALLVTASPQVTADLTKLLDQIDRKPQTVEVEVVLIEVPAPKDGKELTPAAAEALVKDGRGQRIKLRAVEGEPVTSTTGGSKPVTTSSTIVGGGGRGAFGGGGPVAQRAISYHPVGTTVKLTARVGSEDTVALDLNVQDSRVRPADPGDEGGAAGFETASLSTKLNVPAGKAVFAQTVRTDGKAGATVSVVVVTARVVPSGPRAGR
jgi:type II secretory pathway component GspD/PulD (secretin)